MAGNFTYRSLVFGALMSLAINMFFAYARLAMATAGMSSDYITAGAVFLFFVLVAFINPQSLRADRNLCDDDHRFSDSDLGFYRQSDRDVAQYLLLCHTRE